MRVITQITILIAMSCLNATNIFGQKTANETKIDSPKVQIVTLPAIQPLTFYGDLRTRFEDDWGVTGSNGTVADERFRMRGRMRLGLNYEYDKNFSAGFRLRSEGNPADQQSANFTLGNTSDNSPIAIGIDRAFIKYTYHGLTAWTGKNTNSFYYHDEFFWSENVTHEGFYTDFEIKLDGGFKIKPALGFFFINSYGAPFKTDLYWTESGLRILR
jgi:hypothetical protein